MPKSISPASPANLPQRPPGPVHGLAKALLSPFQPPPAAQPMVPEALPTLEDAANDLRSIVPPWERGRSAAEARPGVPDLTPSA